MAHHLSHMSDFSPAGWQILNQCFGSGGKEIKIFRVAFINDDTHAAVTLDRLSPFNGEEAERSVVFTKRESKLVRNHMVWQHVSKQVLGPSLIIETRGFLQWKNFLGVASY